MINYYSIADTHFGHKKIIEYCNRPFSSIEEMDETMINNWNGVVKKNDVVFHLGDFSWYKKRDYTKNKEIFERLNGNKIHIQGNHDNATISFLGWDSSHQYLEQKLLGKNFVMFHYPIHSWNRKSYGSIHLHGHIHNNFFPTEEMENRHNVSVEVINYTPVNLKEFI